MAFNPLCSIVLMSLFSSINAAAQFSYTDSDGTVISCAEKFVHTHESAPMLLTEEDIPEDLPEEEKAAIRQLISVNPNTDPIITKVYVEVKNETIYCYKTSALSSSPEHIFSLEVEHANINDVNLSFYLYDPNDSYIKFLLGFSSMAVDVYTDENGVKSKTTENRQGDHYISMLFSTELQASAFIDKIIGLLPNSESDKEAYRYLMKRAPSRNETVRVPVLPEPTMDVIAQQGSSMTIKGKIYYKYDNQFYDASFYKFCTYYGGDYKIKGETQYQVANNCVFKNKQKIAFFDMGEAFLDGKKTNKYLKVSNGIIYKYNTQLATYKSANHIASSWHTRDIIMLLDYLGL